MSESNQTRSTCPMCDDPENSLMLECSKCKLLCHFKCAGVTDQPTDVWQCKKCSCSTVPQSRSVAGRSHRSNATSTSTSRLELKRLEEQHEISKRLAAEREAKEDRLALERAERARKRDELLDKEQQERTLRRAKERAAAEMAFLDGKYEILRRSSQRGSDSVSSWVNSIDPTNQVDPYSRHADHGQTSAPSHLEPSVVIRRPHTSVSSDSESFYTRSEALCSSYQKTKCNSTKTAAVPDSTKRPDAIEWNSIQQAPLHQDQQVSFPSTGPFAPTQAVHRQQNPHELHCPQFDRPSHDNTHAFQPRNEMNHDLQPRQIATRQVLPRDLPPFNGLPEEWPIFISNLEESTRMCGYTNSENLIRLQRSLRGKALDTVRCLLLLPDAVPSVIETLRMRFGNPEMIINNILHRIRSEPHIKAERLDMIIEFSIQVQNMCATMEAARMRRHLSNPTVLQELAEKLPVQQRLQWGAVLQTNPDADLSTFSTWLQSIARAASTVTSFTTMFQNEAKSSKGGSKGVFAHVNPEATIVDEQPSKTENSQTNKRAASQPKPPCHACNNGHHKLETCRKFKELSRNQRWNLIKEKSLCYMCLVAHSSSRCSAKTVCGINDCPRKHHRMLHNDTQSPPTNNTPCNAHQIPSKSMLYRIIPVTLYGTNTMISTFAFIDEGSSVTLIQKDIAETLRLSGTPKELCLQWTSEVSRVEEDSQVVNLHISGQNDNKTHKLQNVRTVNSLQLPTQSIDFSEVAQRFPYLKGLPVQNYENAVPTIMIGLDNYNVGIPLKVKEGGADEPTATKTRLGWIVHGPISNESSNRNHQAHHTIRPCQCQSFDNTIHDEIKDYLFLDNLGVNKSVTILESAEVQRARHILESTTVRDERGFTTALLWRFDDVQLPDSLPMARNRLQCLEKKMTKDPELAQKMHDKMHSYIDLGYVRKLTKSEIKTVTPRTWYLPIFAITNPNKPDKFRMVWDAAATVGNVSLNSTLLKGPDLLCQLTGVLKTELGAELNKINNSQILQKTTSPTTEWKFNPPLAPHMGGSWERLIRSIKTSLYAILQTRNPSEELLRTLLLEVESIVNTRPLTHVPIECSEDEALTPNHFLLGSSSGYPSYGEIFDNGPTRRQWKASQQLADKYWTRWMSEYLPTLTRRTKWFEPVKPIEVGDVVLIVDPSSPRNTWPKALVQNVTVGSGGQVRKVTVQTSKGIFIRPASKLAVLDVRK